MVDNNFNEVLAWSQEQGLMLHASIERLCVDGVYGMYAASDIPKNTVLSHYPKENLLPLLEDVKYPENTPFRSKYIHAAAKELSKGESSWGFMKGLYSDDFIKNTNVYYFSEDDFKFLEKISATLYNFIRMYRARNESFINAMCDFDKDLDRASLEKIIFNVNYRSWGNVGFVPIFDMFNHSDLYGLQLHENKDKVFLASTVDYKNGDQIWISYGQKDIYNHAINYGYFDSDGKHFIDFGLRVSQSAENEFQKKIFGYVKNKYQVSAYNSNDGSIHYQLLQGSAFLMDYAPNCNLIDFIRDVSYGTKEELSSRQSPPFRFRARMLQYIDGLNSANKIDEYSIDDFPEKMKHFYHMLKKEKSMLNRNREWVMTIAAPTLSTTAC